MSVRSFFDSNILVYSDDLDSPTKRQQAQELLARLARQRAAVLSTQVLQEYFNAATHKLKVPAEIARRKVELFARIDVVQVGLPIILRAIDLHRLHTLAFWDSLIIAAAQEARCRVLFSEDLQTGRRFDGVEIVNPFA